MPPRPPLLRGVFTQARWENLESTLTPMTCGRGTIRSAMSAPCSNIALPDQRRGPASDLAGSVAGSCRAWAPSASNSLTRSEKAMISVCVSGDMSA